MENYIQNIELINNYLNKSLPNRENLKFENRLKTDAQFNGLFEAHIVFLEGLKRQSLKLEIKKARQSYVTKTWFKYIGISIIVLVVSVLIFTMLNIQNDKKINDQPQKNNNSKIVSDSVVPEIVSQKETIIKDTIVTEKEEVEEKTIINKINENKEITKVEIPEKLAQTFRVNTNKDTTIVCKEGAKLGIKSNSFIEANNTIVSGVIELNVTEYYKRSDILLAHLTTTANEDLLETGGMLFIEAIKNESILKLKENTHIEIAFPSNGKKENMQLFSGEWNDGIINWTLEKQDNQLIKNEIEEAIEIEEDIEVPFSVIEQIPVYPGCENLNNISGKNCMSSAITSFIQRNFNANVVKNIGLKGRIRINTIFKIDKLGNVFGISTRAPHPDLERETNRVISLLPKMQPGKQRGKVVTVPYSLPIIFQVNRAGIISNINNGLPIGTNLVKDSIVNDSFKERFASKDSIHINVAEVNNYILRSSKLGWINCDRFINNTNKIRYRLKIEGGRGAIVNMVFKSFYGVIPSWKKGDIYDFKNIPNGEDILLIAIKKDQGKLYFDIVETTTQPDPSLNFEFKEVTLEGLKTQLKKIDSLFSEN